MNKIAVVSVVTVGNVVTVSGLILVCSLCDQHNYGQCLCSDLSGCLSKSGPLDFGRKNSFPLFIVGI